MKTKTMPAAGSSAVRFESTTDSVWRLMRWASARIEAGTASRQTTRPSLELLLRASAYVEAEQVHGAGIAVIERADKFALPVSGCDGLLTASAGTALFVRTADCLPVFFADGMRGVIGLAHAGWRGLSTGLITRMVSAMGNYYHSQAKEIRVAIGPAIRSCCYVVGPEFERIFSRFIRQANGQRICDLIAVAIDQLQRCGIPPANIFDSKHCTACEVKEWFSLRKEGPSTGRLTSFIMLRS